MRISIVLLVVSQGSARIRRGGCAVLLACLVATLALGVVAHSASTPALSFAAPREYPTGEDPQQVAIGDLDGDGKRDLATANFENGTVSVLINRGDGSFEPRRDYAAGDATAWSVAIGDLDGDGRQDLVVAGNTLTVRLNRGAGRFPRRDYESGDNPFSVAIGDVNGDGKPDLATANPNANSVSVLLNKGDGTFGPHVDYPTGREPQSVAIGDLNGDRNGDLAIANTRSAAVSVILANGDGTFRPRRDYGTRPGPRSVAIADLDGNGTRDLAIANHGSDTLSVFLNSGDGSFGPRRDYRTVRNPEWVAIGDLNGDGRPDLATIENLTDTGSVLLNSGTGTFERRRDYRLGEGPNSLAIGDLNGDRKPDLATANVSFTVSVRLNATGRCGVPNVRGKTVADAKRAIGRAGCRVGKTRSAFSNAVRRGHVISERPSFGVVLQQGARVDLVVSLGRKL